MDPSPILSIIHTVTIDTMLNNNGANNGPDWAKKTLRVNKTRRSQKRKRYLRTNIDTFDQRTTSKHCAIISNRTLYSTIEL